MEDYSKKVSSHEVQKAAATIKDFKKEVSRVFFGHDEVVIS